jgi:hypothetical protein
MRKIWMFTLALTALLLTGCASGPKFNTVESGFAPQPADKARIFFYRAGLLGGAIMPEIKLNGIVVGRSEPNGIFFVDQAPGNMECTTSSEVEKRLTFTIAVGEIRYVKSAVGLGVLTYRIIPELVSTDDAKKEIADLAYTGNNPKQ